MLTSKRKNSGSRSHLLETSPTSFNTTAGYSDEKRSHSSLRLKHKQSLANSIKSSITVRMGGCSKTCAFYLAVAIIWAILSLLLLAYFFLEWFEWIGIEQPDQKLYDFIVILSYIVVNGLVLLVSNMLVTSMTSPPPVHGYAETEKDSSGSSPDPSYQNGLNGSYKIG